MLAWVEQGCLHGPVFLLSEDRRLLFSGFFHNGRPQGWIAAASPSPNGGHGLLFLKMEDIREQCILTKKKPAGELITKEDFLIVQTLI